MSLQKQRTGQIGVNVVERVVLRDWNSRWQPIDSVNDDGVDGLIFVESRGRPTGQIIFVQVKCQKCRKNKSGLRCVPINREQLNMNIDRWRRVVGAVILVHVDPVSLAACWVNVRDPSATGATQVFVPITNTFDKGARKNIALLCGTVYRDILIKRIDTTADDFKYLVGRDHIQRAARAYFQEMEQSGVYFNGSKKRVRFTREGWHHITRRNRPRLTQYQSFQLLGAVRRIIETLSEEDLQEILQKKGEPAELVFLRAAVTFPFRHTSVVKVILKRRYVSEVEADYSFHTVYEPRRKLNIVGVRD